MANRYIKIGEYRKCMVCDNVIYLMPYEIKSGKKKFCSKKCLYKSGIQTKLFKKGHKDFVPKEKRGHTEETKRKISISSIGKHSKEFAWNYKKDRTLLVKNEKKHLDSRYREWAFAVKNRDNWKCKIKNNNCYGKLEAHHILPWSKFPELRYNINNGISLCQFHHPRKRKDEIKLAPIFQQMVLITV